MSQTIDRLEFLKAIEPEIVRNPSYEGLSWHGSIQNVFDSLDIESLYLKRSGALGIPFTTKDVEALKKRANCFRDATRTETNISASGYEIAGDQFVIIPKGEEMAPPKLFSKLPYYALEKMLEIDFAPLDVTIEAHFDKLILCENGQSHEIPHCHVKEPGMFASLILQVPMITEQPSGMISFHCGAQEAESGEFDNNQACHFAAVTRCWKQPPSVLSVPKYVIQSQSDGIVAVMVFNLVWVEYFAFKEHLPSEYIPEFFIRAYKISEALAAWNPAKHKTVNDISINEESAAESERKNSEFDSKVDADKVNFLCLPVDGLVDAEFGLFSWNLRKCDDLKMRLLSMVRFIDVDTAFLEGSRKSFIQQGRKFKLSWKEQNQPGLILRSINYRQRSIKKKFKCLVEQNNLVGEFTSIASNQPSVMFLIILIRPRMLNVNTLIAERQLAEIGASTDLIRANLADRLLTCRLSTTAFSYCPTKRNILSEFNCLFNMIEAFQFDYEQLQKERFSFTKDILGLCAALKAEDYGLRALNFISSVSISASCSFPVHKIYEFINDLTDFICFASSWQACRQPVCCMIENSFIVNSESSLRPLLLLAERLLLRHCTEGAIEVIDIVLSGLTDSVESKQAWWLECHGIDLTFLAVKLDSMATDERSERILTLASHFSASLVAQVMKALSQLYNEKKLHSSRWILKIWTSSCGKSKDFTSEQCFEIANIFLKISEEGVLQSFCDDIFSKCIENPTKKCLFYEIVTAEQPKIENREEILKKFAAFPSSKQAFLCLIDKISEKFYERDITEVYRFSQFFPVDDELISKFSSLFSKMEISKLCQSAVAIFKISKITKEHATASRIFESLLRQITSQASFTHLQQQEVIGQIFVAVAWFGDKNIMHKLLEKFSHHSNIHEEILRALHSPNDGENNAASSLRFNREIFNLLILHLIATIKNLNETNRILLTTECFQLLIKAEKSFIDSIDHKIITELQETIKILSAKECLKVTTIIFKSEIDNEDTPKLKKFPACWNLFSCLCGRASSQMNKQFLAGMLPEDRVRLMQSFFWIADEKRLMAFCKAIDKQWRYALEILSDRKTAELALGSTQGLVALDELLDIVIGEAQMSFFVKPLKTLRKNIFIALANKIEINVQEVNNALLSLKP